MITLAPDRPSAIAISRPRPRDPPVTSATLLVRSNNEPLLVIRHIVWQRRGAVYRRHNLTQFEPGSVVRFCRSAGSSPTIMPTMTYPARDETANDVSGGRLVRTGAAIADWAERWFPDAFVIALLGVLIVFGAGLLTGTTASELVRYFGEGFWSLLAFTMQMALIVIGGFAVASSPPVHAVILKLARVPRTPRGAVVLVSLFSMLTSMISWGFSLVITGILVREVVRNVKGVD